MACTDTTFDPVRAAHACLLAHLEDEAPQLVRAATRTLPLVTWDGAPHLEGCVLARRHAAVRPGSVLEAIAENTMEGVPLVLHTCLPEARALSTWWGSSAGTQLAWDVGKSAGLRERILGDEAARAGAVLLRQYPTARSCRWRGPYVRSALEALASRISHAHEASLVNALDQCSVGMTMQALAALLRAPARREAEEAFSLLAFTQAVVPLETLGLLHAWGGSGAGNNGVYCFLVPTSAARALAQRFSCAQLDLAESRQGALDRLDLVAALLDWNLNPSLNSKPSLTSALREAWELAADALCAPAS